LARRLKSYVVCGVVEKRKTENNLNELFNSAYIVDREGKLLMTYRKTFMYEADLIWHCKPGK